MGSVLAQREGEEAEKRLRGRGVAAAALAELGWTVRSPPPLTSDGVFRPPIRPAHQGDRVAGCFFRIDEKMASLYCLFH